MNLKDIKIGTQLKLGYTALLLFVVVLGIVSYWQSSQIHQQTETIYDHPLKVRRALGSLEADILSTRIGERDLMLATTEQEKQDALQLMELSSANAQQQFSALYEHYLGPRTDIDEAYKAFVSWNTVRNENTVLAISGEIETATKNIQSAGLVKMYREKLMVRIKVIDDFSVNKGDSLYAVSQELQDTLRRQLVLIVMVILLLTILINYLLLRNIRKPIDELTAAAQRFRNGELNARSPYELKNEFGGLSASFNSMAQSIQAVLDRDKKVANLAALMLSEYDAKKFFQATLNSLATHTGSQMAAIYLLSDDKKTYEHFESTGVDNNARQSFAADTLEGEFGPAISSRKVQHIKNIPDDTRFVFYTVSGKFVPREIITLPILADNEVVAVISLASVNLYSNQAIQLIDNILVTLCARVEGIMAYHKMKEFLTKLEFQNSELESQKAELSVQSEELMEQNTELELQKKQLGEANRLKTNFLSNMSHELRTPLNSVIALSGVLNRRLANRIPEEEYSYLEVIERNGRHLLDLINDILDISRIEAGREEIETSQFDVNNLISEIISLINPLAQQKNIGLLFAKGDARLTVTSDAGKCRHILQNLIGNAVKFTEKGKVEITSRRNADSITIVITDTGIGISEINLPHIFDEFRQADSSASRKFGGTGLGLAIAKKYAQLLGITIAVKSTIDEGSEFTITLPLRYAAENRISDAEEISGINQAMKTISHWPVSGSSLKTILLVDDSEPAIVQLKDMLEESGYQLLVARDGAQALAIISQTIPDAMILDLMMPGIDGFEVLKTVREAERTAHIPVLILSAKHITKEELGFLKRNHIHQLIQKGDVNRNELLGAVETMVFPEKAGVAKPRRELQTIRGKVVVLVVEDNPDNMLTVKALLADDYIVIEAVNGEEGVTMARKHRPNLILMDIALPEMDGIEAFRAIRKDAQLVNVPVIALTASAMTSDREIILAYGFDAYIAKPIDSIRFFKIINQTLYGK